LEKYKYLKWFIANVLLRDKTDRVLEKLLQLSGIRGEKLSDITLKKAFMLSLDEGEAEVVALAIERRADLVLLDEREARFVARNFGLKVVGTIGVLLRAKRLGFIESLKEEMRRLKEAGFRVSEKLEEEILREAGEL